MEGTPQELAELAQRLQAHGQGQGGNATNRTLPDPNGIVQMLQPIIANVMDMHGSRIAKATGSMTPENAFFSQNVVAQQWERATNTAVQTFSGAINNAAQQISNNLNLAGSMGMSSAQLNRRLSDMTSSPLGMMGAQQLLNMPAVHNFMGGSILGAQQAMFRGRSGFTDPGEFMSILDQPGMRMAGERARLAADAITRRSYMRPDGQMGVTPDFGFTRGFRVEDIAGAMSTAIGQGATRGPGREMFPTDLARGDREAMRQVGQFNGAMENLKQLMGGGTMNELMGTLSGLTGGKWASMDWGGLNAQLGKMSQMARMLDMSGEQMVGTVTNIQGAMRTSIGVSPMSMALSGNSGGAFGNLPVAVDMMSRIGAIAKMRGITPESPEYAQVVGQQIGLAGMGLNSKAGRTATIVEDMMETGALAGGRSNPLYLQWQQSMTGGTPAEKTMRTEALFNAGLGGGSAEGWGRVSNAALVRDINSRQGPAAERAATNVMNMMTQGQYAEYGTRQYQAGATALGGSMAYAARSMGMPYVASPADQARMRMEATQAYFSGQANLAGGNISRAQEALAVATQAGDTAGIDFQTKVIQTQEADKVKMTTASAYLRSTYDAAGGGQAGYMAVQRQLQTTAYAPYAAAVGSYVATAMPGMTAASLIAGGEDAFTTRVKAQRAVADFRLMAGTDLSAADSASLADMARNDPAAAIREVEKRVGGMEGAAGKLETIRGGQELAGRGAATQFRDIRDRADIQGIMQRGARGVMGADGKLVTFTPFQALGALTGVSAILGGALTEGNIDGTTLTNAIEEQVPGFSSMVSPELKTEMESALQSGDKDKITAVKGRIDREAGILMRDQVGVDTRFGTSDFKGGIRDAYNSIAKAAGLSVDSSEAAMKAEAINGSPMAILSRATPLMLLANASSGTDALDKFANILPDTSPEERNRLRSMALYKGMSAAQDVVLSKDQEAALSKSRADFESTDQKTKDKGLVGIAKVLNQAVNQAQGDDTGKGGKMTLTGTIRLLGMAGGPRTAQVQFTGQP